MLRLGGERKIDFSFISPNIQGATDFEAEDSVLSSSSESLKEFSFYEKFWYCDRNCEVIYDLKVLRLRKFGSILKSYYKFELVLRNLVASKFICISFMIR